MPRMIYTLKSPILIFKCNTLNSETVMETEMLSYSSARRKISRNFVRNKKKPDKIAC